MVQQICTNSDDHIFKTTPRLVQPRPVSPASAQTQSSPSVRLRLCCLVVFRRDPREVKKELVIAIVGSEMRQLTAALLVAQR